MKITNAQLEELDLLVSLFEAYRNFYKKDTAPETARLFLKERIERKDSVIFIATNDDRMLTGFVQLYPIFSSTRMKRLWLLNDLYVHPDYRGQGISKALIEKSKYLCMETDACGLLLETEKTNLIGNRLYTSTGFEMDIEHNYYSWNNVITRE